MTFEDYQRWRDNEEEPDEPSYLSQDRIFSKGSPFERDDEEYQESWTPLERANLAGGGLFDFSNSQPQNFVASNPKESEAKTDSTVSKTVVPNAMPGLSDAFDLNDGNPSFAIEDILSAGNEFLQGLTTQWAMNNGGDIIVPITDPKLVKILEQKAQQSPAFLVGKSLGDIISILQGLLEIGSGGIEAGSGAALAPTTGSTSLVLTVDGAIRIVHGGKVIISATGSLSKTLEELLLKPFFETYVPAPDDLPAFPDAKKVKKKTPRQGGGGLRERWKDRKGKIYEWDYQHGTVERYNKRGKHEGEFDPETGKQLKEKEKTRTVEP